MSPHHVQRARHILIPPDPSQQVIAKIAQALAQVEEAELVKRQLAREGVSV